MNTSDSKFYVARSRTGQQGSGVEDEGPFVSADAARHWAQTNSKGFRAVTVLVEDGGKFNPLNAGKRFLHAIVK